MPDIVESWKWRDPGEIIDRLIVESEYVERRDAARAEPKLRQPRDRHHIRALQMKRRQSLKNVMNGRK